MTFTYDLNTQLGKMRLLLPDTNEDDYIFSDEEFDVFSTIENANLRNTVALALETIASSQVLLVKSIRIGKLQVDTSTQYDRLMDRARTLRGQTSSSGDDLTNPDNAAFDAGAYNDLPEWAWG